MKKFIKKHRIFIIIVILLLLLLVAILFLQKKNLEKKELYHVAFEEVTLIPGEEVAINVIAGEFAGEYPAISFQIDFDSTVLEFIEIQQGNIVIWKEGQQNKILPAWPFEAGLANNSGQISTMYLDLSGGEQAYEFSNVTKDNNVLFRLVFRVKESADLVKETELRFEQATFATVSEEESLSMQKNNVVAKDKKYMIQK